MIKYLLIIFHLLLTNVTTAQENNSEEDINSVFYFKADSIEKKTTIAKWETDTRYFLHYTVKNISSDTLTYITNSCLYYNHYFLKVGQQKFDLNPKGSCYFNALNWNKLAPGEEFKQSEWIIATNLSMLETGNRDITLSIPVVNDEDGYRVDGRDFVQNKQYLFYSGKTKIMETILGSKRQKKQRK